MAALGAEFHRRGCRVTAIVPNLSFAKPILGSVGIAIVEMTPHLAPCRAFPISINYTANLLRNGFWHSGTLTQRLLRWRKLLDELQPDLLICDHAPSALLASREANYARVAIGNGFTLPPLFEPMPGIQPWFSLPLDLLVQKDREFLDIVNPVLDEAKIAPLKTVASMFEGVRRFLCVEAELDHYPIRSDETYWGAIDPVSLLPPPEPFEEGKTGVFVYMSATNRFLESLINSLAARGIPVLAYISGNSAEPAADFLQAPNIRYLQTPVDLHAVARTCRAVVTHGGTLSASIFLRNSLKLLICPPDLEKAVLGTRLQERKLAYAANWFSPEVLSEERIDELLAPDSIPANLSAFAKQQATLNGRTPVEKIVDQCELLLP
jgi:hypothetical protein